MITVLTQRKQQNLFVAFAAALTIWVLSIPLVVDATEIKKTKSVKVHVKRTNPKSQLAKHKTKKPLHKRYRQKMHVQKVSYVKPTPEIAGIIGDAGLESLPLYSKVVYVVDQRNSKPLIEKNSTMVLPIASITKLMTAMVVLDANLSLDERLTVSAEDRDLIKYTSSRLMIGSTLSRREMLLIALMSSENRAASALSRYYPGGEAAFIDAMNAKALSLGMLNTHFKNSTGLSSENVSTAQDLVKMVNAAYDYPLIREYSTLTEHSVDTGKQTLDYHTSNALLRNKDWEIGLQKTGYIRESGKCVVIQAVVDDMPVIMVLLNAQNLQKRFSDAMRVHSWLNMPSVSHYADRIEDLIDS